MIALLTSLLCWHTLAQLPNKTLLALYLANALLCFAPQNDKSSNRIESFLLEFQ
jgi:hypothetical protein